MRSKSFIVSQYNTMYLVPFCNSSSSAICSLLVHLNKKMLIAALKGIFSHDHSLPTLSTVFFIWAGWINTHGKDGESGVLLLKCFLVGLISSDILQVLPWFPQQFMSKSPRSAGVEKVKNCWLPRPPLHHSPI